MTAVSVEDGGSRPDFRRDTGYERIPATSGVPRNLRFLVCERDASHLVNAGQADDIGHNRTRLPSWMSNCCHYSRGARFSGCYASSERPFLNRQGMVTKTVCSSHGDDTAGDGASLTAPQPSRREETRVPPECLRFPLSAGWNLEGRDWPTSDGRIPRRLRRGGGQ